MLDPIKYQSSISYNNTDEVWRYHQQSCDQIKYDKEFFYGVLLTACRNISNKTIIKHSKDRDGILAWVELKKDFDNDGSTELRMETLEAIIQTAYIPSQPGGLAGYIDKFMTALHELEILQGEEYTDMIKKRCLLKTFEEYLVQLT